MEGQQQQQTRDGLAEWARAESARIEERRETAWQERGFKPFLKLPVGESAVEFADAPPRSSAKIPGKAIFRVKLDGREYDLAVRESSTLYRELARSLSKGNRALRIVRTGTGRRDTQYSVRQ